MADFMEFLNKLKNDILELGKHELTEHSDEFLKDGQDFVNEVKEDLKTWTKQLAAGEMSEEEFKMAVSGKAELAKMKAITQLGLTKIRIDKLKQGIIDTVVSAAITTFIP